MQLSTADLHGDVRAAFEVGYHTGRFYSLALAFVATGLVQDDAATNILQDAAHLLPEAGLPEDLLAPVTKHWHSILERIKASGALDPKAVNDAEIEADRIIDRLGFQIAGELVS